MAFSLFNFGKSDSNDSKQKVVEIKLDQIVPNRYQPRQVFDKEGIQELAQTIDEHGLLQPIVIREYEPAKYENLQRSQLSSVEEAQAYRRLMDLNHLTQAALAKGMGKSQSFVANKLRLLKLIKPVQTAILDHRISERHGRAMLDLNEKQQREMLMRIVNSRLTVRQTEDEVARLLGRPLPSEIAKQKAAARQRELSSIAPVAEPGQEASPAPAPANDAAPASKPAKKASRKKNKTKPAKQINDARLALNTIKKSIKLATDSGFKVTTKESDNDQSYQLVIEIPKKQ